MDTIQRIPSTDFPIESFKMMGVYGYKNLSMKMKDRTTIFVSENGTGKTTILNALNYVLRMDLSALNKVNFTSIAIKLRSVDEEIRIEKSDMKIDNAADVELLVRNEIDVYGDFWEKFRMEELISSITTYSDSIELRRPGVLNTLYGNSPYDYDNLNEILLRLKSTINESYNRVISEKLNNLKEALDGYEIIYLPTYRRVEKSFEADRANFNRRDLMKRGKRTKLHHGGIAYGLRDVEDTLSEITLDIERQSSVGYRALSARMLDDLIRRGNEILPEEGGDLPAIEDLERFLNRIERPQHVLPENYKKHTNYNLIEELKGLYVNGKIKDNKYLNYFLSKLNPVIQDTKEQEFKIESFVSICNKYLKSAGDSKFLMFDTNKLEVVVNDDFSGERIALNDLSSGEKQVISLMAILYLGNYGKKILLIDEPELSLSLKWQRLILPDVDVAKDVSQVIAITHSPFIYDNDLETCATALSVAKVVAND